MVFLTYWLKPNRVFLSSQLLIILPYCQVFDSNSQHRTDNSNHFSSKKMEKARHMSLSTKVVAIYVGKKAGHYCQTMTRAIDCYLLSEIDVLYKLIKKYEYDKLIGFYILLRSGSKNVCLSDKQCKSVPPLFCN